MGGFSVSLLPLDFWGNESAVYDYCDDDDAPDRANDIIKKGATLFAKGEDFGQVIREGGVQTVVYLDRSFLSGKR